MWHLVTVVTKRRSHWLTHLEIMSLLVGIIKVLNKVPNSFLYVPITGSINSSTIRISVLIPERTCPASQLPPVPSTLEQGIATRSVTGVPTGPCLGISALVPEAAISCPAVSVLLTEVQTIGTYQEIHLQLTLPSPPPMVLEMVFSSEVLDADFLVSKVCITVASSGLCILGDP